MNPFERRAISKWEHKAEQAERWVKGHLILSIVVLLLGLFTLKGVVGAVISGNPFSMKQILISAMGEDVKTDRYGHTNILLIGVGGEGHDGENLTDTMIVASLDHKGKTVSMISIPRDFYVENDEVGWGTRINSVYEYVLDETDDPEQAMEELLGEIESILDVDIHYYAKIDFAGFVEVIDALGGVEVEVSETIYDASYPADPGSSYLYETFSLGAGVQQLDGETALKYVRSRHNTSDFDRARRQQQVLAATKEKALSIGFLANPGNIKDLYSAISRNFESDMSLSEMLSLVDLAENLDWDSIQSAVLNDEAYKMGGFLYTPPRDVGDPYYLIPYAGDNSEIQLFAQLFFYHPEIYRIAYPIQVLNGTREESLAGLTKMYLTRYGFNVTNYGNAAEKGLEETSVIPLSSFEDKKSQDAYEATLSLLHSLIFAQTVNSVPVEYSPLNWETDTEIIIELGEDFAEFYREHDELFYIGVY